MEFTKLETLAAEAVNKWHAEPARVQKAVEIVTRRNMIYNQRCEAGEYDVRSQTDSRAWYHVDTNRHTCTCKDSRAGHACKHKLAVWMYTEQIKRDQTAAREDGRKMRRESELLKSLGYAS